MREKVVESLVPAERRIFNVLTSEHQREGFLIVRAFAKAAEHKGDSDFAIAQFSLADRLSITPRRSGCHSEVARCRSNRSNSTHRQTQVSSSIFVVVAQLTAQRLWVSRISALANLG